MAGEENIFVTFFGTLFEVFAIAESKMANEQVECITKALRELEFTALARMQHELESRAAPLRYIQRLGRPILEKPGKNLKDQIIVIQAAEFARTTLKQMKTKELQIKCKASVDGLAHLKYDFLSKLSEYYRIGICTGNIIW